MSSENLKDRQEDFFRAIEIMQAESKTSLLIFAAPIVALMSQLRFILTVEAMSIKILLTLAVVSLLSGTLMAMFSQSFVRSWYAKEVLFRSGAPYKGDKYVKRLEEIYSRLNLTLDEDGLLKMSTKIEKPMQAFIYLGWLPLVAALVLVVWK